MNSLQPGQTYEIDNAYVRMINKVLAHVIVHRLTKQQQQKRLQDQAVREKRNSLYYN
ncbi:hypothetical protein BCJMU51_2541 [Bacillus cereus]|nr:hypothetical protein BCM0045_2547 [Bacillus cereus]BCC00476.1 hypothetical protein BCM0057_2558 [Bacillus cereus]BCC23984.1 hypothetical protein BCM0079_2577 [Bacillus cereus]BCC35578.1 hypothetical protein BCM0105_2568 [Bacillus cereus]BCC41351.1 hypothetical protein BCJMU01_2518 [Bacillus cereus]